MRKFPAVPHSNHDYVPSCSVWPEFCLDFVQINRNLCHLCVSSHSGMFRKNTYLVCQLLGPLTWKKTPTSRTKLVGVVSFGSPNCGIPNAPTVFGKVTAVLPWIQRTTRGCSSFYTSTCGIVPAPRPLGQACDLDDTLRRNGHQNAFMGKTEEATWFNSAINRNVQVLLKCDWSLKCQLVSGGWSQGESTCQKICGSTRCWRK